MAEWILLDPESPRLRHQERQGSQMAVYASPYDVPEAIRFSLDPASGWLRIDLRYIDGGEKTNDPSTQAPVRIWTGRRSGRVYRIDAELKGIGVDDMDHTDTNAVVQRLVEYLVELTRQARPGVSETSEGNKAATERVLKECERELLIA
ncbi:MAG: hypothetical protein HUU35_14965 [Armatimonadetes bacterium]|nr:hypothetical protein [Armatimonadota bacterium]